jgi:DeoR/GlpR family transcriptional regulator of sugar metabolism
VLTSLDERGRRLFAGLLARERGHGGVVALARITGLSRTTIRRGLLELERDGAEPAGRVRGPGGGRKRAEKKTPA